MQTPGQIETGAGVRGDGSLWLHVLKGFTEHVHLCPGGCLEGRDHRIESIILRRHEALPTHDGELGALLGFPRRGLCPGLGKVEQSRPGKRAGRRQRGAALKKSTASEVMHSRSSLWSFLICYAFSRLPVASSNRC